MKSVIYLGKEQIKTGELPMPECGENDILIKNVYSSIYRTDAGVCRYGMVSKVVKAGSMVQDIYVGDRVYPYPCFVNFDSKCAGTSGSFSPYMLIPNAELGKQVYPVPEQIPSKVASLIEPFTIGCRAARRSFPRKGEHAVIFGAGAVGIAAAIALKYFGCNQVMICDYSDFRLKKARALGFIVCNNMKESLKMRATTYFGEAFSVHGMTADVDIFIDTAGTDNNIEIYQDMGKINSRMLVDAAKTECPADVLAMTYAQHTIIGYGGFVPDDVDDVLVIMRRGNWDISSIITHEYSWEELSQAIEKAGCVEESLNVVIRY